MRARDGSPTKQPRKAAHVQGIAWCVACRRACGLAARTPCRSQVGSLRSQERPSVLLICLRKLKVFDKYLGAEVDKAGYLSNALGEDGRSDTIRVKDAPEPAEINWENLQLSARFRLLSRSLTWTSALLLVAVSSIVGVVFRAASKDMLKDYESGSVEAIGISLGVSWLLMDPLIIVTRNTLKNTKTIIRSKRYQIIEKFVVAPLKSGATRSVDFVLRMLG